MRKILLCIGVVFMLVGCSNSNPKKFDETNFETLTKMVDVFEEYSDGKMDDDDFIRQVDALTSKLDEDLEKERNKSDIELAKIIGSGTHMTIANGDGKYKSIQNNTKSLKEILEKK